ncbi:MAG: hypothetical protein ABW128_16950 [Rhizorhabdus sp.]
MILKKQASIYETTDQSQFLTQNEAENHQISIDLSKIFENSEDSFGLDKDKLEQFIILNRGAFAFMFNQLRVS